MMGMEIVVSVMLLLVGIAVLVIIHVCIVGRAFGRNNQNNGGANVIQRSMNRSSSMSQDDIKKLPSFDYKVEEKEEEKEKEKEKDISSSSSSSSSSPLEMECAVCLDTFKVGEKCRLLPKCKHSFHVECIDSWLLKAAICPICRTGTISPKLGAQDRNQVEVVVELV